MVDPGIASSQSPSLVRSLLPSSLVSVGVHVFVFVLAMTTFRGCQSGAPAEAGGQEFREIGLALIHDAADNVSDRPFEETAPTDVESADQSEDETPVQESPPIPQEVPSVAELLGHNTDSNDSSDDSDANPLRIIGPGDLKSSAASTGGLPELIRPQGRTGMGAAGSPTPALGQTSFMNIVGTGQSFVYVIDTSSSMGYGGRMTSAKSQLLGSLQQLKPNQSFQVIFYNIHSEMMKFRGRAAQPMYPATALHQHLARAEIDRVTPEGGTAHLPPILQALKLEPDVVYFLTDADEANLSDSELRQVRSANRSGARIHVIVFATGPEESRTESWLQLLAGSTGGEYRRIVLR